MMRMNEIVHGDSYAILPTLEANSVDLLCTDPPYGAKFMGKQWDRALPDVELWQACLRVLKPGAFAFVMSLPRLDLLWRMASNLEQAGFMIAFTPITWAFASGFPKAQNISKQIDKRAGAEREVVGLANCGYQRKGRSNEEVWQSSLEEEQKIVARTKAATPEAQAFEGAYAGFQPKPAVEMILVAMKPMECETYVDQALTNGKGVTWLDDGRIPFKGETIETNRTMPKFNGNDYNNGKVYAHKEGHKHYATPMQQGRFPANLLVSDDALNDGENHKSGQKLPHTVLNHYGFFGERIFDSSFQQEKSDGSFSRYFDLDAWFAERLPDLPDAVQKTFPYLIVPKPAPSEKSHGGRVENRHPTVKPMKLFSYLLTIGSRPGDLVLDPFSGSGTTALAARRLGRNFLCIEKEEEYWRLSCDRLSHDEFQPELFGAAAEPLPDDQETLMTEDD